MISNKYGWLFMEMPILIVIGIIILPAFESVSAISLFMLTLFCFHYFNRVFIFPFRLRTRGKMMPLAIVASAVFFNIANGFSIGYYFTHFANYSNEWITDILFVGGLAIFLSGMWMNWKADNMLIHLRKPGETHNAIPQGWLFKKISCPNLLGELIEWMGFAILCWNPPAFAFFIWTAANLIPRALSHHKWYIEKFKNYPKVRKAIFPNVL